MNSNNLFKASFFAALAAAVIGVARKITHASGAEEIMILAFLFTSIYMICGIMEVNRSPRINSSEKIMWTVGFLFMSGITAIVYLVSGRRRIADN
ncbi:MAG: putative transrane protein [Flaviaesturariibacter sp.]|nr:putative transrane protein [Flaviaesturariibacter sp.]